MDSLALRAVYSDEFVVTGQRRRDAASLRKAAVTDEGAADDDARRAVQLAMDRRDNGGRS
ncbi:MAG: hypothetical protein GEV07_25050 [Streptosporangiales bacterium]|nr:hypothetical protein [Streptosporangiales bacterium]